MKLAVVAILPALVAGYGMGGYSRFGGNRGVVPPSVCRPPSQGRTRKQVDRDFDSLRDEMDGNFEGPSLTEERLRQQQEWVRRAFGLAAEVAAGVAAQEGRDGSEARTQQEEWLNQAFGIATDVASGFSSPRFEIRSTDDVFEVALDVPGVKPSDIDIRLEHNGKDPILTISGERDLGKQSTSRANRFSKSFTLDVTVDTDKIAADLKNGVLVVSAPKKVEKTVENGKKIPVRQATDDAI